MGAPTGKNRWLIAASAVGIHLSIGSVYAWSVFAKPIVEQCGWNLGQIQFSFSLAILFLGLSAAFFGKYVEKYGPRKAGLTAAALFGLGLIGSGLAVAWQNLALLYLFYGVMGGMGLGVGYIAPISTLVKWFPDRRGLATGLAIMGFGFAALIGGPLIQRLIVDIGLANAFFALGAGYFLLMSCSALYLAPPGQGDLPERARRGAAGGPRPTEDHWRLTAKQALRTRRFYLLWLMLFINITCGIAIISVASPMGQELAGLSAAQAAAMVGLIGLFNGGGRLAWAGLSDYIGRVNTYTAFFAIQIITFFLLPKTSDALLFQGLLFLTMTCYGGGFACVPAYIGDIFGTRQLAVVHGYILTAWAAAGLVGPMFAAHVREHSGGYSGMLGTFIALFAVALAVSVLIRFDLKKPAAAPEPQLADYASMAYLAMPATFQALEPIRRLLVGQAKALGLDHLKIGRLELAVEEAVSNVCQYAYNNEAAANRAGYAYQDTGSITVRVKDEPTRVVVELEDSGLAFDPLSVPTPDLDSSLEERQVGRMGVHLIRQLTDAHDYFRRGEANVLRLAMNK